jgi:hypothetical protein
MEKIEPIKTEHYNVSYEIGEEIDIDTEEQIITTTIICDGALRLSGMDEYEPIVQFFDQVLDITKPDKIYFDMKELRFLNSSGINVLSKFVIRVRQKKTVKMVLQGSQQIPWQGKSLKNLKRLMPKLQLELE